VHIYRPHDLETATAVTGAYQRFPNDERPHQGANCQNLPPRIAFPALPPLPRVPALVDADRWLHVYDGHTFTRNVTAKGHVMVDDVPYDVKAKLVKQHSTLRVDAALGQFVVEADGHEVQRLANKGIVVGSLPFATFVEWLCAEARTWRAPVVPRL
jgi:hypothetical protein